MIAYYSVSLLWHQYYSNGRLTFHLLSSHSILWFVEIFSKDYIWLDMFIYTNYATLCLGKKRTSFISKPQEIQRDDVGSIGEEASTTVSTWHEISPSWSDWIWPPQNHPLTIWFGCSCFKGLSSWNLNPNSPLLAVDFLPWWIAMILENSCLCKGKDDLQIENDYLRREVQ